MTLRSIAGWAAALSGLVLIWQQVSGTLAYMNRGASLADAASPDALLILASAVLVVLAGLLAGLRARFAVAVGLVAAALNGLVLFLTMTLGTGRLVWIAGALAEIALILAIALAFLQPKNDAAPH